jgi:hypothetical protein
MATFPSYAKILREGFAEQRESALLRTEMESGPPRQTKIKSRVMITRPVKIYLDNKADYLSFETWFAVTINEGADWFDWLDPVSGTTKSVRFVGSMTAAPLSALDGPWAVAGLSLEGWHV